MKFLSTSGLFETIHHYSFQSRDRVYAAIAFVGKDSYQLLHENIRNVRDVKFIVNFSDNSVRSGSTNPAGVGQLRDFAEIRNKEDLHAKLYIFDNVALVGSANLSKNATSNIEAGILVEEIEEVSRIIGFFRDLWNQSSTIDSNLFNERSRAWIETSTKRARQSLPAPADIVGRRKIGGIAPWKTPIPAPRLEVPAIVWSVGKIFPDMQEDRRQRRDVELHKKFINEHGAVYWSAGWDRHHTTKPINGYLYMSQDGSVKYSVEVEKIIRNTDLTREDKEFIPGCRKGWEEEEIPTWIKITEIKKLKESLDPTSMIKWKNHKPIRNISALQSAVMVVDEFWE